MKLPYFGLMTSVLLTVGMMVPTDVSGADWPWFLGPNGDGTSPETGLVEGWKKEGLKVLWSEDLGSGYGAPSVRGDKLVVHHRVKNEEIVECRNVETGKVLWRHAYPSFFVDPFGYNNGPRACPWLTESRCYTFGAEGRLVCLDLETGKLIWEKDTSEVWTVPEAFFGVGSSPVIEDGVLLVMVGGQPNSGMVGLDPETGKVLWESVGEKNWEGVPLSGWPGSRTATWATHWKQASYASPVIASMHGRKYALCLMRQGLVGLNPKTGAVDFSFWFRSIQENSVNASNPVVLGNQILISAAYYRVGSVLLEVNEPGSTQPLKEVWRGLGLETHWSTAVYSNGYLYALSGRNEPDARFRCVEFSTGKVMWDRDESWNRYGTPSGMPDRYGRGSIILADGKLIVLGEGGLLGLMRPNPERLEELARFQVPGLRHPCWSTPVLSNKRLFIRSEERLVCLDFAQRSGETSP